MNVYLNTCWEDLYVLSGLLTLTTSSFLRVWTPATTLVCAVRSSYIDHIKLFAWLDACYY